MIFHYFAVFLVGILAVPSNAALSVTVEELINAIGAPKCMQKCVNSFVLNLYDSMTNSSVQSATRVMCNEYYNFIECAKRDRLVCPYEVVYNYTFEGLNSFCSEKETPHSQCLDSKLSLVAKTCDNKCHLTRQIDDIFQRRTIKIMAKHSGNPQVFVENLTEFCQSLSCFIPCFKRNLEHECDKDGHRFLVHAVKPFYSLVRAMKKHPKIKPLIEKKVPKTCHFLFNKAVLDYYTSY
uniref:CPG4 domain-containing protein n=1 Tax=Strongyloides papillosus TaxID=174720 RepID=A0A0N5B540_STREA